MNDWQRNKHRVIAPDLAERLTKLGVDLPTEVTDAVARIASIHANPPQGVTGAQIVDAYLDGDTDEADRLAILHATFSIRQSSWNEAWTKAGAAAMRTFEAHGEGIVRDLATIAKPLISQVMKVGAFDTIDTAALLRAGRTDDASAAAGFEFAAQELSNLYGIRDKLTADADYGHRQGWDCAIWRDPRAAIRARLGDIAPTNVADGYRRTIQAGGKLWFPTPTEAQQAASKIVRDEAHRRAIDLNTNAPRVTVA